MFAYCANSPVNCSDPSGCRPPWEHDFGNDLWGYTDTSTGTPYSVGAAPVYHPIEESNDNNAPNCYAFAIGSPTDEQPGNRSGVYPSDGSNVYDVADSVIADFQAMGRSIRIIDGPYAPINANEYRIALRVGTKPIKLHIGNTVYFFYDYHFMVQTSTGQWAEKHGHSATVLWPNGLTPNEIPWTLNGVEYYDSDIIYFAVEA